MLASVEQQSESLSETEEVEWNVISHEWQDTRLNTQCRSCLSQRSDAAIEVVYVPGVDMCVCRVLCARKQDNLVYNWI